jgi:hypothetical protein
MSNYFSRYCELLNSADQLSHCRQANSLVDLLLRIKTLWGCVELGDDELLGEINRLNRIPVEHSVMLSGNWLPYRYQPGRRLVNWLMPSGHATEPFQDEYISRCMQMLFNQIIQPCSSLGFVQKQASNLPAVQPAGFIFHLSRCGSTLISGCLSELDSTCVFSESPLLTELLLDNRLSLSELTISLRTFINLQVAAFSDRPNMIIKWNAWDILRWDLIRGVYPDVPVIFLIRHPREILASHHASAGRHMSGDPSLCVVDPIFSVDKNFSSMLDFRMQIIKTLMQQMLNQSDNALLVDYRELDINKISAIAAYMGIDINSESHQKIWNRMQFHSKLPGKKFQGDARPAFTSEEDQKINQVLADLYHELLNSVKETTYAG